VKLSEFSFPLPDKAIARFPAQQRDESRLMVVNRSTGAVSHHLFKDIVHLTQADDFFVVNNSAVIPSKLFGEINGKTVECLIVRTLDPAKNEVEAYALPGKKFTIGSHIHFQEHDSTGNPVDYPVGADTSHRLSAEVVGIGHRGKRILRFNKPLTHVFGAGYAPLPPYIKRKFQDAEKYRQLDLERYQTVYSRSPGSIAAPTAGLHFTPDIVDTLKSRSPMMEITLEVGEATFQKIETDDISQHRMGAERITITHQQREEIAQLKKHKNLIAVGTTSVRSLESLAHLQPEAESFISSIFISPGFEFMMVDKLVTNFHLPESSLFILTSAFGGLELMQKAYRIAIDEGYRFFSYGDAMLIN